MHDAEPVAGTDPGSTDRRGPWREPARGGHPDVALAARPGIDFLRAMMADKTPQPPLSHLLGMRLVEADAATGTATFTMPLTGWLCDGDGRIPLGALTIPADAAMACAIIAGLPEATALSTSELSLRQVRPAVPGTLLTARASVLEPGPPLALAEVSLTDEQGRLIAHGGSLCIRLPLDMADAGPASTAETAAGGAAAIDAGRPDPWRRPAPPPSPGPAPLSRLTGLRAAAGRRGEAEFLLPTTRWLCAPPPGRLQGGTVALLADAAITAAIASTTPGAAVTPVEIKLNFLRPLVSDGRDARARARLIHGGRRIGVAEADVVDADGRPIAVATGSAVVTGSPVTERDAAS